MKKRFVFLFLSLFYIGNIFICASTELMEVYEKKSRAIDLKLKWGGTKRSITPLFFVSYEDGVLFFDSDILIEDVTLFIKDKSGNVIYTTMLTIYPDETSVSIINSDKGHYLLEVEYDNLAYYGYFEISQ